MTSGAGTPRLTVLKGRGHDRLSLPARHMERELISRGLHAVDNGGPVSTLIGRALGKYDIIRQLARLTDRVYVVSFMQPSGVRFFPQGLWAQVVPLCYDCWPPSYHRWVSLFRRMGTRLAFFTSRQSARYMADHVPGLEAVWLPEAIDVYRFDPARPLAERTIDVLEFGRRWADYHEKIVGGLDAEGLRHLFQRQAQAVIFPREEDFVQGLNDTKIAICFPGSLTHPDYSAGVETMTQRYLEAIAAGCLLVGRCPSELEDLFGFNPVIEADMADPVGQIKSIISDIGAWEPLRQRSLGRVREVGHWAARVDTLLEEIGRRGYWRRSP